MQRDLLSICDIRELLKRIYYIQPASSLQTILKHELYAERFVAHICGIALRGFILYKLFACWKMCVQQTYHPVLICTFLRYIFLCYLGSEHQGHPNSNDRFHLGKSSQKEEEKKRPGQIKKIFTILLKALIPSRGSQGSQSDLFSS